MRLSGLLERFLSEGLGAEGVERFFVFGGECNYLLRACVVDGRARLVAVAPEDWQGEAVPGGPKPYSWPAEDIKALLDIAEASMRDTIQELHLRAAVLRKDRAIGVFPGGAAMSALHPEGHGSNKIKREALDELVLRVMDAIRLQAGSIGLPFCVFNGGSDAWLDIGNKSVAVAALQAYLSLPARACLHVGDQFLNVGNDIAARETCPCIWIINPRETGKVLQHVLRHKKIPLQPSSSSSSKHLSLPLPPQQQGVSGKLINIYTGELLLSP